MTCLSESRGHATCQINKFQALTEFGMNDSVGTQNFSDWTYRSTAPNSQLGTTTTSYQPHTMLHLYSPHIMLVQTPYPPLPKLKEPMFGSKELQVKSQCYHAGRGPGLWTNVVCSDYNSLEIKIIANGNLRRILCPMNTPVEPGKT